LYCTKSGQKCFVVGKSKLKLKKQDINYLQKQLKQYYSVQEENTVTRLGCWGCCWRLKITQRMKKSDWSSCLFIVKIGGIFWICFSLKPQKTNFASKNQFKSMAAISKFVLTKNIKKQSV
jgi:hypothetical protein